MKIVSRFFMFLACVVLASACAEEDITIPGNDTPESAIEHPMRIIKMTAGSAVSGEGTRATLSGVNVLWDKEDKFAVASPNTSAVSNTIQITAEGQSKGIGIPVGQSGSAQVKYDYIQVILNGVDKTEEITNVTANASNNYKFGIYNSQHQYQYAPAGTVVTAEINSSNGKYAIPIAQTSSSSVEGLKATVTLRGIQYSLDSGKSWIKVDENTTLTNGFGGKGSVAATWQKALGWVMTAEADALGHTSGGFSGSTTSTAEPDASTLAIFPSEYFTAYEESLLSISLPQTQTYAENSFDHKANVMVGPVTKDEQGYSAEFWNMMGVMMLQLKGNHEYLSEITITDNGGNSLWGNVSLRKENYREGISTQRISGGSSTLTLRCPGVELTSEAKPFYFVVPVGAFEKGFDVTVRTDDGRTSTFGTNNPQTISLNSIKRMAAKEVKDFGAVTINLENDAVQQYMSYGKYASFGSTSYFGTYSGVLNERLCVDKDYPQNLNINWNGDQNGQYTVTLTDNSKHANVYTDRSVTGTSYSFVNMVPGHEYSYVVKQGTEVVRQGDFKTEGQVRMVTIADSWNWRDLGGWTSTLGGSVQYEWLYRGGSLNGEWNKSVTASTSTVGIASNYTFSTTASQQVIDLGIKAELDLRGKTGDGQAWSQESGIHSRSIEVCHLPDVTDYKQLMTDQGLQNPLNVYSVVQDVAWIIDQVVNKNHPVAFHCKSGADRTGAVSMIILALLGVDPGDIARDYELTTLSHEKLIFNGSSSFQTRRADQTSYAFFKNGFTTKSEFNVNTGKGSKKVTYKLSTMQEQAYYYLNRYFSDQGVAISSSDLDAFIKKMLGKVSYTHPTWAIDNDNQLVTIYNK